MTPALIAPLGATARAFHPRLRLTAALCAGFASAAITGTAQAAPQACTDTIDTSAQVLTNGFAFDSGNSRNQQSLIHSGNVRRLQPVLTHSLPEHIGKRGAVAVTSQTVYFTEGPFIVARNRATGCEYWRFSAPQALVNAVGPRAEVMHSSAVQYLPPKDGKPALVYAGDVVGTMYALDAQTGAVAWARPVGTDPLHMITGGFQIHKGVIFVPLSSREVSAIVSTPGKVCCTTHGVLQAVDAYTGAIKWTYHTAPPATYNETTQSFGPSGMSIWTTPMIDAANNHVVIGTAQNFTRPTTANSDALIALDMETGAVKWTFQSTTNDAYTVACEAPAPLDVACPKPTEANKDFDFGAPAILADLPLPWQGKAIIAGSKNGIVYSLNPKTGTVNWSTRIGSGGSFGGIHWGMAVDSWRVYAAVTDLQGDKAQRIEDFISTEPRGGPVPNAQPGIYALDLRTGRIWWKKRFQHTYEGQQVESYHSAALSITNDVLFAGSLDGRVRALRTLDGEQLWSFDTAIAVTDVDGEAGKGGTIDSVGPIPAGRELYVNSGYGTFGNRSAAQGGYGNTLFVFRLNGLLPGY